MRPYAHKKASLSSRYFSRCFSEQVTNMEGHVVGDILVDYSASEGLHSIYVKCTCVKGLKRMWCGIFAL